MNNKIYLLILCFVILSISIYAEAKVTLSQKIIAPDQTLTITIEPGKTGVMKYIYFYDSYNNLKDYKRLNCRDICTTTQIFNYKIPSDWLGNYYLAVYDYDINDYIKTNFTVEKVAPEITFDRKLSCAKCGQHKAPPLTNIEITITAKTTKTLNNVILIDYFPKEWTITNPSNGTISNSNNNYNKIEYSIPVIENSISETYAIKSPQRTTPSTKYYFQLELNNIRSDLWQVIVADPTQTIEVLHPIVHVNTELDAIDLTQSQVDTISNDDSSRLDVLKGSLLTTEVEDTTEPIDVLNGISCSLNYQTDPQLSPGSIFEIRDSFNGNKIDSVFITISQTDTMVTLSNLETKGLTKNKIPTMVVYLSNADTKKPDSIYVDEIKCDIDYMPTAVCVDSDNDGYFVYDAVNCPTGDDCNDANENINPGATEICDGIDNNCDSNIDFIFVSGDLDNTCGVDGCSVGTYYNYFCDEGVGCSSQTTITDNDNDGYDIECDNDCDDTNENINPGATEICNNLDDDCDILIDEDLTQSCGTTDVGECQYGTQTCTAGVWGICTGAIEPQTEICDNKDNDCDSLIDEDITQQCGTTDVGACEYGTQTCTAGVWASCIGNIEPTIEICNNIDDDCDGTIDESLTQSCGSDIGECQSGLQTCSAGIWGSCIGEIGPSSEVCDALDNDCNTLTDDGIICDCLNGQTQSCGTDIGECQSGIQTCVDGQWGSCVDEIGPLSEVCNNLDDDCDSLIDEDLTQQCGTTDIGVCEYGLETCTAGIWQSCTAILSTTETCNGLDDDCDGTIDEDLTQQCGTTDIGVCEYGLETCTAGIWQSCTAILSTTETCNGLDDDCDGTIDEDLTKICGTTDIGVCQYGTQACTINGNGDWGSCFGNIEPTSEICDGLDNDCDGPIDETCCSLISASWSTKSVNEGDLVELSVTGDNACNNKKTNFVILEKDEVLGVIILDLVNVQNLPNPATFSAGIATSTWITEWYLDEGGLDRDPEYVFTAITSDDSINSQNELKVLKAAGGTEVPIDSDSDGIEDDLDECPDSPTNAIVNNQGCELPTYNEFENELTTNFSEVPDLKNVENAVIAVPNIGKIEFQEPINAVGLDMDSFIEIQQNLITVDKDAVPELNKSAIITLYNVNLLSPLLQKDGAECNTCTFISYTNNIYKFSVAPF